MGRTIDEALKRMKKPEHQGVTASFDMLGEAARTQADAARYFAAYTKAIDAVGRVAGAGHSISVKLSALHPRYEVAQYERCVPALTEMLEALDAQGAGRRLRLPARAERRDTPNMTPPNNAHTP